MPKSSPKSGSSSKLGKKTFESTHEALDMDQEYFYINRSIIVVLALAVLFLLLYIAWWIYNHPVLKVKSVDESQNEDYIRTVFQPGTDRTRCHERTLLKLWDNHQKQRGLYASKSPLQSPSETSIQVRWRSASRTDYKSLINFETRCFWW